MRINNLVKTFGLAIVAVAVTSQAGAAVSAFTISNTTGAGLGNPPFTLGFQFTTSTPILVSQLGLFDDSQDGLVERHPVGLFNSAGSLLASTTIQSGTGSSLINQFRYESITAVLLAPGTYAVGALYTSGSDALIFPGQASGFATASGITFNQSAFVSGGSLAAPTSSAGSDPAYFGPNFQFTPVPEPSTVIAGALLMLPLGIAGIRRLRNGKSAE